MATPLTTTDPAELANLSRCFSSCVPIGLHMPLRTLQLNNVAVIVTNPVCDPPTAPLIARVVATSNNSIRVVWKKSAHNTGGFVTGWIVSWGTTSGGPYPNSSGVLPLVPGIYDATGLTAGTTYYFTVTALTSLSGCTSVSLEGSGTTSGAVPICAFAVAWAARVVANGGAVPSLSTQTAICNFQAGLIADGLDTKMVIWNAFVPDSFIASSTAQLQPGGGFDPW